MIVSAIWLVFSWTVTNDKPWCRELDTGAAVTNMPEREFKQLFPETQLRQCKTYTGDRLPVVGEVTALVQHNHQTRDLVLK